MQSSDVEVVRSSQDSSDGKSWLLASAHSSDIQRTRQPQKQEPVGHHFLALDDKRIFIEVSMLYSLVPHPAHTALNTRSRLDNYAPLGLVSERTRDQTEYVLQDQIHSIAVFGSRTLYLYMDTLNLLILLYRACVVKVIHTSDTFLLASALCFEKASRNFPESHYALRGTKYIIPVIPCIKYYGPVSPYRY